MFRNHSSETLNNFFMSSNINWEMHTHVFRLQNIVGLLGFWNLS
jgi:hypothetical protein